MTVILSGTCAFALMAAADTTTTTTTTTSPSGQQPAAGQYGERVTWSKLPAAVQKGIEKEKGQYSATWVEKKTENGKATYFVSMEHKSGYNHVYRFSEDGKLIEGSRKIAWSELSPAVRTTFKKQSGGVNVEDINRDVKNGRAIYEGAFKRNGETVKVLVDENGKVVSSANEAAGAGK